VTKWCPAQQIQTKVIGICVNKGRLLAMEVYNDNGDIIGVRPLGGVVEFGENRETALRREFQEELKTGIIFSGSWRIFENLYIHEGKRGHEYVFAIGIQMLEHSLYSREVLVFSEDSGSNSTARWFSMEDLKRDEPPLFPLGLKGLL
jgi:hypothetical protein